MKRKPNGGTPVTTSPGKELTDMGWVHRLSQVDDQARVADCASCGPRVPIRKRNKGEPPSWRCVKSEANRVRQHDPAQRRAHLLRYKFGLSLTEYELMLEAQKGACAICEGPCPTSRRLAVDHDHASGRIRGLLCGPCNQAIGLMRDRPELLLRAAEYLTN